MNRILGSAVVLGSTIVLLGTLFVRESAVHQMAASSAYKVEKPMPVYWVSPNQAEPSSIYIYYTGGKITLIDETYQMVRVEHYSKMTDNLKTGYLSFYLAEKDMREYRRNFLIPLGPSHEGTVQCPECKLATLYHDILNVYELGKSILLPDSFMEEYKEAKKRAKLHPWLQMEEFLLTSIPKLEWGLRFADEVPDIQAQILPPDTKEMYAYVASFPERKLDETWYGLNRISMLCGEKLAIFVITPFEDRGADQVGTWKYYVMRYKLVDSPEQVFTKDFFKPFSLHRFFPGYDGRLSFPIPELNNDMFQVQFVEQALELTTTDLQILRAGWPAL